MSTNRGFGLPQTPAEWVFQSHPGVVWKQTSAAMPIKDDTARAASYPCTNPGASVSVASHGLPRLGDNWGWRHYEKWKILGRACQVIDRRRLFCHRGHLRWSERPGASTTEHQSPPLDGCWFGGFFGFLVCGIGCLSDDRGVGYGLSGLNFSAINEAERKE